MCSNNLKCSGSFKILEVYFEDFKTSRTFLFLHFTFRIRASNVIKAWCPILQVVQAIVDPLERNWRFFYVTPSQPTYLSISNFSLIVLLLLSLRTPMLRFAFICIWLVFVNQGTTWQASPLKCDEYPELLISAALSASPRIESFRGKRADVTQFPKSG